MGLGFFQWPVQFPGESNSEMKPFIFQKKRHVPHFIINDQVKALTLPYCINFLLKRKKEKRIEVIYIFYSY